MDLASFKQRYPSFINDIESQQALSDAGLFINMYDIDDNKLELATALMTAHLLSLPKGGTEQLVTKVKADTVEVEFSDKGGAHNGWFSLTSYGLQFGLLIKPNSKIREYGVINDDDRLAIIFEGHPDEPSENYYDKPTYN